MNSKLQDHMFYLIIQYVQHTNEHSQIDGFYIVPTLLPVLMHIMIGGEKSEYLEPLIQANERDTSEQANSLRDIIVVF